MIAVVTGMIASYPVGGVAWDYAQYALGLEKLGFDVYYLEDTGGPTYDPARREYGEDPSAGVGFLGKTLTDLSPALGQRWHFRSMKDECYGMNAAEFAQVVGASDLFLNVSGSALLRPEYARARCKVLIDSDPGWNHFVNYPQWDASPGWQGTLGYRAHDVFLTYAERIGQPGCLLPDLGLPWQPTRPLVVSSLWAPQPPGDVWTTVLTWDNFRRPIEYQGVRYGTKEMEFSHIEALPRHVAAKMEIAAGGGTAPRSHWCDLGWRVIDSHQVSATADEYRSYVQSSRGEFSVAKNVYVATRSGWFSCRSICYLASGRPVVIQDTGFTPRIPSGEGLFAFTDLDSAIQAVNEVERNYAAHSEAAQQLSRRYFGYEAVLGDLLERAGVGS